MTAERQPNLLIILNINKMKKITLSLIIILFAFSSKAQTKVSPVMGCSDLYFSELTFGQSTIGNITDLNYAVELFNPTQRKIGLSNYTLALTSTGGSVSNITFNSTDSIAAGDVFVVCNSNANLGLQALADHLSSNLDYANNVRLELKHSGLLLDRIGEPGNPTPGGFNYALFFADPIGYAASFHLDLNDFQSIDMRRGMLVDRGDTVFASAISLIGKWAFYPNTDVSDIGTHYCTCDKSSSNPIVGFKNNVVVGDPYLMSELYTSPLSQTTDPLLLQSDQQFSSFEIQYNVTGGNASWGSPFATPITDMYFYQDDNPTPNYGTGSKQYTSCLNGFSNGGSQTLYDNLGTLGLEAFTYGGLFNVGYTFSGNKTAEITLSDPNSNFTVDQANKTHYINLAGNTLNTGYQELSLNKNIVIYPKITSNEIKIYSKDNFDYQVYNTNGVLMFSGKISEQINSIEVSNFANGLYLIKFTTKEGFQKTEKFIKI